MQQVQNLRTYAEWEKQVPECITADALWTMQAYRLALFASDLAWEDCLKLKAHPVARRLADQLVSAVGSIGANLAEGYGRGGSRDRAHFFEYALGSAREARHWYYQSRGCLGDKATEHRLELITDIIRQLLGVIKLARQSSLREDRAEYAAHE